MNIDIKTVYVVNPEQNVEVFILFERKKNLTCSDEQSKIKTKTASEFAES